MDQAMEDLDKDTNCPDGVPPQIWERLCMYRRQKVEYETQVSQVNPSVGTGLSKQCRPRSDAAKWHLIRVNTVCHLPSNFKMSQQVEKLTCSNFMSSMGKYPAFHAPVFHVQLPTHIVHE